MFENVWNGKHIFLKFVIFGILYYYCNIGLGFIYDKVNGNVDDNFKVDENLLFINLEIFLRKFIIFAFLLAILIFLCRYTKPSSIYMQIYSISNIPAKMTEFFQFKIVDSSPCPSSLNLVLLLNYWMITLL
jgi:hypothetical protein